MAGRRQGTPACRTPARAARNAPRGMLEDPPGSGQRSAIPASTSADRRRHRRRLHLGHLTKRAPWMAGAAEGEGPTGKRGGFCGRSTFTR